MKPSLPTTLLILLALTASASADFFAEEPALTLDGEDAVLSWSTGEPTPPARASFGIEMPDDPFRSPRWRSSVSEKGDSLRRRHELRRGLGWWEYPSLDAAGLSKTGGLVLARVEAWDRDRRTLRYRELRMAYRREEGVALRVPCVALGPWIDRVGPRDAWLSWTLDRPAPVKVEFGPKGLPSAWRSVEVEPAIHAEIRLDALDPDSEFGYRVVPSGREASARKWSFRTPPEAGAWPSTGSLSFAFMSDGRAGAGGGIEAVGGSNRRMIRSLLSVAEVSGVDFICFGGDLIDGYVDDPAAFRRETAAWKKAAECVGPRLPIYESMGNHEILADFLPRKNPGDRMPPYRDKRGPENSESLFAEAFVNPENGPRPPARAPGGGVAPPFRENVYSFDWGPVHVAALNNDYDVASDPEELGGYREGVFPREELDWLDRDLQAARSRGQAELFVIAHEPAFPCGGHAGDGMWWKGLLPEVLEARARFWNLLQKHGVRAAMFGDEHNYSALRVDERLGAQYRRPVWHIVSGGVGAPYYAKDESLPWAEYVNAFSTIQHFCRFEISREGVVLSVLDSRGRVIDRRPLD